VTCNASPRLGDPQTMTKIKRRWSVRVKDPNGADTVLVVSVVPGEGVIRASIGRTAIVVAPEKVERVRQVWDEARAAALWDRGSW
jgi:hypothetical protein